VGGPERGAGHVSVPQW
jgi:hypothetical protein